VAFQRLMEEFDLTADLVGSRSSEGVTGKDRTTVANAFAFETRIQDSDVSKEDS